MKKIKPSEVEMYTGKDMMKVYFNTQEEEAKVCLELVNLAVKDKPEMTVLDVQMLLFRHWERLTLEKPEKLAQNK
jgi:hypothetical protein